MGRRKCRKLGVRGLYVLSSKPPRLRLGAAVGGLKATVSVDVVVVSRVAVATLGPSVAEAYVRRANALVEERNRH